MNIDVKKIAKLANLPISSEDLPKYTKTLPAVLDLISKLKEIDTENVDPTSQVTGEENVWREDEIDTSRLLKHDNKHFKVKAILE